MDSIDVECRCYAKSEELMGRYFGNLVNDASVTMPAEVGEGYTLELPEKIAAEYREFLAVLWKEIAPDDPRDINVILNHSQELQNVRKQYANLPEAYSDAEKVTLWEKLTKSNHEDVTYFKGLLKSYSEELVKCMIFDFREEVRRMDNQG